MQYNCEERAAAQDGHADVRLMARSTYTLTLEETLSYVALPDGARHNEARLRDERFPEEPRHNAAPMKPSVRNASVKHASVNHATVEQASANRASDEGRRHEAAFDGALHYVAFQKNGDDVWSLFRCRKSQDKNFIRAIERAAM